MKLKYGKLKPNRIKNQFYGITSFETDLWWADDVQKWLSWDDAVRLSNNDFVSTICPCKSVEAFKRRLKKFPKDVVFVLVSKYVGYDVSGINKT